jgi:hypothetical protein
MIGMTPKADFLDLKPTLLQRLLIDSAHGNRLELHVGVQKRRAIAISALELRPCGDNPLTRLS